MGLFKIVFIFMFLASPAFAQAPKLQTYILSASLLQEIANRLSTEPYANVAQLIAKLESEIQHQPPPPAPCESPDKK